jgi:hypothetical protein
MQLLIKRDQKDIKGLLGGHKGVLFSLFVQAFASAEEQTLIEKYKIGEFRLTTYELGEQTIPIGVNDLLKGHSVEVRDIAELLSLEEEIKSCTATLKTWITVAASFGGEERIGYE